MDHQASSSITPRDLECMLLDEDAEPKALPFSLLGKITNGFSYKQEIGKGGFAMVYKGMLEHEVVAVKRLCNTYMYENEFLREVECLMKVKHKNIVRFLGYCSDTQGNMERYNGKMVMADIQQRLLCFEYLPKGGLDSYIKDPSCGLEWRDRYAIIRGICEGLHHLHQINIVHLDLKPANILLDENLEPKITDFGISRSFEQDQTRVVATKVVGTLGYMAPEFVSHVITQKYDLYSLGVIIIEILTGEKGCQCVETVVQSWSDRLNISHRNQECEQIRVCVDIGIKCTNIDPANRPANMKHIIERLVETERTEEFSPKIKIIDIGSTPSVWTLYSLDTNQAKQWIITGEDYGHVCIWNYQTQKKVAAFKLSEQSNVVCVKFIARQQWFAAGTGDNIYVYSYETKMQKITVIHAGRDGKSLCTLAVHPTKPYLLSSDHAHIKLWNWDKNWECTHKFGENNHWDNICQITLSSEGTIASASRDCKVKVYSLDSAESNFTLSGHSTSVNCLDFFTCNDQEYLVTGSDDKTAKIWDIQKKTCLHTMEAFMSPVITVLYQPSMQILIIGSEDGSIYLWKITSCSRIRRHPPRLEQTVNIGGGVVLAVTCAIGSVVIGKRRGLAIMDIDYGEPQLSAETRRTGDKTFKVISGSREELPILHVHRLELGFYELNKAFNGPVHLTNMTDEHVAFRIIIGESQNSGLPTPYFPMYGIVPPRSTYTLVVRPRKRIFLEEELTLQSSTSGERYIIPFKAQSECDKFFEEALEIGSIVHEVALRAPQWGMTSETELIISPRIKIISVNSIKEELYCLYAHPTESWIITGHAKGVVQTWKHHIRTGPTSSFIVSEESENRLDTKVRSIKYIATKQWIVIQIDGGYIHVYNCVNVTQMQKITKLMCDDGYRSSIAVHPVQPYVLSTAMVLWNGNKGWECTQWNTRGGIRKVAFNPKEANSFASVSFDGRVEVLSLDSSVPKCTLSGHSKAVNCLDFYTHDGRHYLITGSDDFTVKIWDLQEKECIHTLEGIASPVTSVISLPGRPYLVTGSEYGIVQVWSSTDLGIKRTVDLRHRGPVRELTCLMGSQRVVVGQKTGVSVIDIEYEEGEASTSIIHSPQENAAANQNISPLSLRAQTIAQVQVASSSHKHSFLARIRECFNMSKR